MNPETRLAAHERRRMQPWPQPRAMMLPHVRVPQWPPCREPAVADLRWTVPLRIALGEFVREARQ